jgi:hypothetical protein
MTVLQLVSWEVLQGLLGFVAVLQVFLWHFSGDSKCNLTGNLTGSLMTV